MEKILASLYKQYANEKKLYKAERLRISCNEKNLKKTLNKNERKLLLRIRDDSDLIIEKAAADNFFNGVNVGIKLMLEALHCTK